MNIKKFALTLLSVLSATSLWAAPEHVYSALPYEPATPHEFQSDWEGKLVIHPEAFGSFDLTKYKYSVSVKTDTGVQVGFAQWSDNDTKESNFSQEDDGVSGEFTVELSPARVRSMVNDGYCLQFNKGGTGKLYYVRLVTTERDPSEVEIDFSAKGFTTRGTKIIDGNGNEFVPRGLNFSYAWHTGDWWVFKSAKEKGCNALRVNISNGGESWMSYTSPSTLESIIYECEKRKMVVMPCPQDGTCQDGADVLTRAVDYWIGAKDVMNRHIGSAILNISNEWYSKGDETSSESELQDAAKYWSENYVTAVKRLREAGIKNLIVVDVSGCGQGAPILRVKKADGTLYAQDIIDADPDHNIAFSIHMYHVSGRTPEIATRNIKGALDLNVPVMLGEYAFEHKAHLNYPVGGPIAWKDVQKYTCENNVGWFVWSWSGNGGDAETCDMFDGNGDILENGKCMLWGEYGIERTSTECTIFSTHPGGPGLAYQYPTGPFEHEIYNPAGGHGYEGEIEEPETGTYKDPVAIVHDSETGDNTEQWNHVYTISPETFADHDIAKGGKLSITLNGDGSNPEAAAYYNHTEAGYDHNANGSDHLIGDYHDGPYYYVSVGDEYKKETVLTQAHVDALTTNGLRIDASHSNLGTVSYAALDVTLEVDDIAGDTDATATPDAIYTLSGIRVGEMRPGEIYIIVRNGRATKELHR